MKIKIYIYNTATDIVGPTYMVQILSRGCIKNVEIFVKSSHTSCIPNNYWDAGLWYGDQGIITHTEYTDLIPSFDSWIHFPTSVDPGR